MRRRTELVVEDGKPGALTICLSLLKKPMGRMRRSKSPAGREVPCDHVNQKLKPSLLGQLVAFRSQRFTIILLAISSWLMMVVYIIYRRGLYLVTRASD